MLFNIIIGIHIKSQLKVFSFVTHISSKTENFGMSEIWAIAIKSKKAIGGRKVRARAPNSPDLEPASDLVGSFDGELPPHSCHIFYLL
jgi:hypothetical protein